MKANYAPFQSESVHELDNQFIWSNTMKNRKVDATQPNMGSRLVIRQDPVTQFYFGSVAAVGLFILYRVLY